MAGADHRNPNRQSEKPKSMEAPERRCLYDVLCIHRNCTANDIQSAYNKLALWRHPDKLIKSGVSEFDATAAFQELVNAYEVLSDARERAWYDSHRSMMLLSSSNISTSSPMIIAELLNFFKSCLIYENSDIGKGFYDVYGDVFDRIYVNEVNFANKLGLGNVLKKAPLIGSFNAFYRYWLGFVTVMNFVWVDQCDPMVESDLNSRRVIEEENKKIRKKARREYNEMVKGLAEFVKKRDMRVISLQLKRDEEMERKKEEMRARKKAIEREKTERERAYEEEEEIEKKVELYCVVCGKTFKSDQQWKNHERSKKHKRNVAAVEGSV